MLTAPRKSYSIIDANVVPALSGSRVMATTERKYKHINTSLYSIRCHVDDRFEVTSSERTDN